ncbi:hypothetical protein [Paenarthrobacter ureafaciens]|uniref:hypothetical protein n=1 Tax=Paenarthrobacter ureafaciens TaxID=37931 RepID=UPI002DBB28A4|nr:hypothetical protein [Paenarthrobacter ureafaciens]MEC3853885.1 hypothetical protein [Paenarthrobacter ureafaciens]
MSVNTGLSGWEKITEGQSHVWQMFVFELNRQARTCKTACDRTLLLGEALRTGQSLKPAHLEELSERVEQAVSCASSLRNLIYGSAKPRDKKLTSFWEDRVKWIQTLIGNPPLPTIKNVSARNSLEHFDERMDSWAYDWAHRSSGEEGWIGAFDCVVASRGVWGNDDSSALVRCYIADEATFVIRDDEIHIPMLMREADTIVRRLRAYAGAQTSMWKSSGAAPQLLVPL